MFKCNDKLCLPSYKTQNDSVWLQVGVTNQVLHACARHTWIVNPCELSVACLCFAHMDEPLRKLRFLLHSLISILIIYRRAFGSCD